MVQLPAPIAEVIVPGIEIGIARKTLRRHGYDDWDIPLSISSGNERIALDTCSIDDNITLILAFDKHTNKVVRLSLHIQPDKPPVKGLVVQREVSEMRFERDGEYSIKLKRDIRKSKAAK